jgi:IclR helix-turn-helix domain
MNARETVKITLTDDQVAQIVRERSGDKGLEVLLSDMSDARTLTSSVDLALQADGYSRSTLRALLVLSRFPADQSERELTEVAGELGFSTSTTHRYLSTWVAVGVLQQDPDTRRYRRASMHIASLAQQEARAS